jgi:hypothetical protein
VELTADTGRSGRNTRVSGADVTAGGEVKLIPGGVVDLINLSETGALVEGRSRLAVGASVTLSIGGESPRKVAGRVVRCNVSAIHRDSTMSYQIGLAFQEAVAIDAIVDTAPAAAPAPVAPPPVAARPPEVEELVNEW